MRHVLEHGHKKTDRTGTGTLSVFGYQMRSGSCAENKNKERQAGVSGRSDKEAREASRGPAKAGGPEGVETNTWLISLKGVPYKEPEIKKRYEKRGQRIVVACAKTRAALYIFDTLMDACDEIGMSPSGIRSCIMQKRAEKTGRMRFYYERDYNRLFPEQPLPTKVTKGRIISFVNVTDESGTQTFNKLPDACRHIGITKSRFYKECKRQGGTRSPEINGRTVEVIYR